MPSAEPPHQVPGIRIGTAGMPEPHALDLAIR